MYIQPHYIHFDKKIKESLQKCILMGIRFLGREYAAVEDYVAKERAADFKKWESPALFLSPATNAHGDGRLNPRVINTVWIEVCSLAGVEGPTPHDARHAMGRHLIEKTGNIAAVQRQLGHTNAAYSIQYARITDEELGDALKDR